MSEEYPKIMYHKIHGERVVLTAKEEDVLGSSWRESPADTLVDVKPMTKMEAKFDEAVSSIFTDKSEDPEESEESDESNEVDKDIKELAEARTKPNVGVLGVNTKGLKVPK